MKNNQSILERVKSILAESLDIVITKIDETQTFIEHGCDEFEFMEFVMSVEDEYGIVVADEVAVGMSVLAFVEVVEQAHKS